MLIDHHCHLDFPDFASDLDGVVARAGAAGVGLMVTISTRIRQFGQVLGIAERYANVFCSVGTHPHNAHEELDIPVEEIVRLARHPKVVAIGEAGLDYYYDNSPREAQAEGFRKHIAAARQTPALVIHAREADDDTARHPRGRDAQGGLPGRAALLHGRGRSRPARARARALRVVLGILTFKKSDALREMAAGVPLDRLLVETDAPYLAPGKSAANATSRPTWPIRPRSWPR